MISLPGIYWKLGHFPVKIGLIRGVGGVPTLFFDWNLPFLLLGSSCKNSEFYDKSFYEIFDISRFSGQNRVKWGTGGVPIFFFFDGNLTFYVTWEPPLKFGTL